MRYRAGINPPHSTWSKGAVTSKKHMNSHEIYKKTYFYEYKLFCLKERTDLSTSIKVPFSSKRVCFVQWAYFLPMYGCYLRLFPWGKFHYAVLLGRFFNNIMTKKQLYSFVGADVYSVKLFWPVLDCGSVILVTS